MKLWQELDALTLWLVQVAIGALRVNSRYNIISITAGRREAGACRLLTWDASVKCTLLEGVDDGWRGAFGREAPFLDYGTGLSPTWPQGLMQAKLGQQCCPVDLTLLEGRNFNPFNMCRPMRLRKHR